MENEITDPTRNPAIEPEVNFERDSYNWLHRHADVLDAQKAGDIDVVMVGDSITHFWSGTPKSARATGEAEWEATFAGLRVLNMGFGWDRTQNVLWRLAHGQMDGLHPKTIVLNIGTNNLVGGTIDREHSVDEVVKGVEAVMDVLHRKSPSSRIVVMGVFPRGFEKDNPLDKRIQALNALLAQALAEREYVSFLDIGAKLREPDGSVSPDIFFDGTHPSARGYAIWGSSLREGGFLP